MEDVRGGWLKVAGSGLNWLELGGAKCKALSALLCLVHPPACSSKLASDWRGCCLLK